MRKRRKGSPSLDTDDGFGLIEVMVAAAIISIIALGIGTLIDDMMKAQKKTTTSGAISSMRARIIANIQNGEAWTRSAADATLNPNMTCMRGGGVCTDETEYPLALKDAAGAEVYYATVANHGFNYDGVGCTNYPNGSCVFRWNLRWTSLCTPSAAQCASPSVTVIGTLEYTPGTLRLPGGFNPASYNFTIVRGTGAIRSDAVMVAYIIPGQVGEGFGCESNWTIRKLNRVSSDPGNNVVGVTAGVLDTPDRLQLVAGTYNCRVQAPAFKNGGNRLRIRRIAGTAFSNIESSSATAAMNGGSANLIIEATLILNEPTTFVIEQRCQFRPDSTSFGTNNNNFSLGVPAPIPGTPPDYSSVTYTTVSCTRTS